VPYSLAISLVSFLVVLVLGGPFIWFLKQRGIGKQISLDAPGAHNVKAGTPTMGGALIFAGVVVATALFNLAGRYSIALPLATMVSCGILGAIDDLRNLTGGKTFGLSGKIKFAWLLGIAVVAALVLYYLLKAQSIYVPFVGKFELGLWYLPVAVLAILACSNAVNLTDGLDTLAGGTTAVAFAAYGVIAFLQGQSYLVTFCFTIVGALLGFLWYNAHPAKVFMGDTGSLALGATLAVVALMTGQWLLLPLIGIVFVAEAASVLAQVVYFRLTGGKRLFKMSPLHHHFELIGWSETQITLRFWLVGMLAAMLGVALALS